MHISHIYAKLSPDSDKLFRQSMALASRHRIVRVHHVIAASEAILQPMGQAADGADASCIRWLGEARLLAGSEPAGCLDAPLTNSPTMRRVLELAHDRAATGLILPSHLLAMALCCWSEEHPPGPTCQKTARSDVAKACRQLGVRPVSSMWFADQDAVGAEDDETDEIPTPTADELEVMIGPAVTADDLICLYMKMKAAQDPAERDRLAARLSYLRDRG